MTYRRDLSSGTYRPGPIVRDLSSGTNRPGRILRDVENTKQSNVCLMLDKPRGAPVMHRVVVDMLGYTDGIGRGLAVLEHQAIQHISYYDTCVINNTLVIITCWLL